MRRRLSHLPMNRPSERQASLGGVMLACAMPSNARRSGSQLRCAILASWKLLSAILVLGGLWPALGAELTGVVRDNLGNGLSNLSVGAYIYTETSYSVIHAVTDEAGRFTLVGEPGYWGGGVDPTPLYARGYFDVHSFSLT